ncbi:hypothetical protein EB72_02215 [Mycobacterium sp. SWH-M1]|nr:hypothetical protein EB72_02215 [Mycobacterium sp. SWH-M1]
MGNREDNLHVVTEHIDRLAGLQQRAAEQFVGANRAAASASNNVATTHGPICAMTTSALADADVARKVAGQTMQRVSDELAQKLQNASRNYQSTDYLAGKQIGTECRL